MDRLELDLLGCKRYDGVHGLGTDSLASFYLILAAPAGRGRDQRDRRRPAWAVQFVVADPGGMLRDGDPVDDDRFGRATAAHLAAAIDTVLGDPQYARQARLVRDSLLAAGGATAAATLVATSTR